MVAEFKTVSGDFVRQCLRDDQKVGTIRIETLAEGHKVQCASPDDLARLSALHGCRVVIGETRELIQVYRINAKMATNEILDLVWDKLSDEEVYNDGRRIAQQLYGHSQQQQQQVKFANGPEMGVEET